MNLEEKKQDLYRRLQEAESNNDIELQSQLAKELNDLNVSERRANQ